MNSQPVKNVKQLLVAARSLIENVGWCQKIAVEYDIKYDRNIAFCAVGACQGVEATGLGIYAGAIDLLQSIVGSITQWNDAPGRTKEEVLAAFDKAIALAATKE